MKGKDKIRPEKLRRAMEHLNSWAGMTRLVRTLNDAELRELESLERLGRRRINLLRVVHAEKGRRDGRGKKMQRLKVEVSG